MFLPFRPYAFTLMLLTTLLTSGCSDSSQSQKPEPLSKLDFRPNSEFGLDAAILGLKLGKEIIDERMPEDGIERAEGYRFLLRLVEMNLNVLSGDSSPAHPQVTRCPSKVCKLGFDNPDYTYVAAAPLSQNLNYRLSGKRGTSALILFQVLERSDSTFNGTSRTSSETMTINEDGSWEIYLGANRPAGVPEANFLKLKEDHGRLLVRVAHRDWNNTIEPSIAIDVLDPVTSTPDPFSPSRMAITGFAFSKMIPTQVQRWINVISSAPHNAIGQPCKSWTQGCDSAEESGFGNYSTGGRYTIGPEQALIIESPQWLSRYQNIQLANIWGESLDYANKQTSLNGFQTHLDEDGVYRYVLSHRDPGVPNWLDISNHPEGAIFMRWVMPQSDGVPIKPTSKVIDFKNIRKHLPASTPTVSEDQRAKILKKRLEGYNRRTNPANIST